MLERVRNTIARFRMISAGERVAVACSGGPDSTALLLALQELSRKLGCVVSVCHFNHRLRGKDSDEDEQFARDLAARLQMDFHYDHADVQALARSTHANVEGKARELRYDFFLSLLQAGKADRIAIGHTADDQAETVLHRLLRGAGTSGLAGIYPVVHGQFVRPLIELRRGDVLGWLKTRKQGWREDASNNDLRFTRNRIRREVLPQLSQFNPRIVESLSETAEIAREEESFWQSYLKQVLAESTRWEGKKLLVDLGRLRQMPLAVARRVLRSAVAAVSCRLDGLARPGRSLVNFPGQTATPDFGQVSRLLSVASDGRSGTSISLPGGIIARKEFSHLTLWAVGTAPEDFIYQIQVPVRVDVPEIKSSFSFQLVSLCGRQAEYNKSGAVLLESRLAGSTLLLRNWQPGDGYTPRGHRTRRKLKDLFQRKRISIGARQGWPVLLAEDEIIWARDLDVAENFSPAPGSQEALLMEERRCEGERE